MEIPPLHFQAAKLGTPYPGKGSLQSVWQWFRSTDAAWAGWCQVTNLPSFFKCNGPLSHSLTGCPACHHLLPLTSSNVALPTVLTHWVSSWFWTLIHTLGPLDLKFHSILTSLSFSSFNSALLWELRYQLFLETLPLTGWGTAMESCLHDYRSIMWC